jgi:GNAT superfamily N-acetyltransferase
MERVLENFPETKMDLNIINADKKDVSVLKRVLSESFSQDPMISWLVKPDKKLVYRREFVFETMLNSFGFKYGHVYTNEKKSCCAIWAPPGKYNPNSFFNLLLLPAWIKSVGLDRLIKIMNGSNYLAKHFAGPEYFYLMSIGTLPQEQGKGIGSALMKPVLDICDRDNIPACLETSNEKNLDFYKRHGFKIREEVIIPSGGPKTWVMIREPLKQ